MRVIARAVRMAAVVVVAAAGVGNAQKKGEVTVWLTNPDKSALFEPQRNTLGFGKPVVQSVSVDVSDKPKYQTVDGFGYALTGGSAQHLMRMEPARREEVLRELFGTGGGTIGVSYLRLTIGASDLNDHVFSYDDTPAGRPDVQMTKFSLGPDLADVIPVMREILAINPEIKILASPWSAPAWMKTNGAVKGGELKPEYYAAYADYFVRYIRGMKAEGIKIDAVTVQNEPLNEKNTPSMLMPAEAEGDFIKHHLGPALRAAEITTKIIVYDHNCDVPQYATTILNDTEARKWVDGSGFHLYAGKIEAMTGVHNAYPEKNVYFTEQMVTGTVEGLASINVAGPVQRVIVGAMRNWSRNVILWNLAANAKNEPHTDNGGCTTCQGAITIEGNRVTRNVAYYALAHASRLVRPGSVRIDSDGPETLANVAFETPSGWRVLIVANTGPQEQKFEIRYRGKAASTVLKAGAVATYTW